MNLGELQRQGRTADTIASSVFLLRPSCWMRAHQSSSLCPFSSDGSPRLWSHGARELASFLAGPVPSLIAVPPGLRQRL